MHQPSWDIGIRCLLSSEVESTLQVSGMVTALSEMAWLLQEQNLKDGYSYRFEARPINKIKLGRGE